MNADKRTTLLNNLKEHAERLDAQGDCNGRDQCVKAWLMTATKAEISNAPTMFQRLAPEYLKKRGGARPGAGRKPSDHPKQRYQVTLAPEIAAKLQAIGAGNLSYGISLAATFYRITDKTR